MRENLNAIIPSAGSDIETFGERQFVVLSNINGVVNVYEIKGERLFAVSDDDAAALAKLRDGEPDNSEVIITKLHGRDYLIEIDNDEFVQVHELRDGRQVAVSAKVLAALHEHVWRIKADMAGLDAAPAKPKPKGLQ